MKIRKCKRCGRSVRETIGKSGYCKKCIKLAREYGAIKILEQAVMEAQLHKILSHPDLALIDNKAIIELYNESELHRINNANCAKDKDLDAFYRGQRNMHKQFCECVIPLPEAIKESRANQTKEQ